MTTPTPYVIRAADPHDAAAIAVLEQVVTPHAWSPAALASTLAATATMAFVAERALRPNPELVAHVIASAASGEGEIALIAVHPQHQRQGIARRLLDTIALRWRAAAVATGWLEVRADNHGAIAFYLACGWVEVGRRRRYYRDGTDAIRMMWVLA